MRMSGGHDNGFAGVQPIRFAVDGHSAGAVQTGYKRVAGFMRADFLAFVKRKKASR